jgi:hypothetical protein
MVTPEVRKKPLTLIKRAKRKLAPPQAYLWLYYNKKLKAIIDARWEQYIAENPSMKGARGQALKFRNVVVKELYDLETDEVKAEVEKRCKEGDFTEDEDTQSNNDDGVVLSKQRRRAKARGYQRKVSLPFLSSLS